MRAAVIAMLVAACAGSAAPASTDDERPAIALVAEADRLILEWKPNYEHPNRDSDDTSDVPAKSRELQVAAIDAQIEAACSDGLSAQRAIAHLDALHYELVHADRATRRTVSGSVRELFDEAHALHVSNENLDHVIAELEKVEP